MNVLDHLIGVQGQLIRCRRIADETPDRAMARREVDRALCSPE
jgi:hypothetical protein